jgi:hypothetical protein
MTKGDHVTLTDEYREFIRVCGVEGIDPMGIFEVIDASRTQYCIAPVQPEGFDASRARLVMHDDARLV